MHDRSVFLQAAEERHQTELRQREEQNNVILQLSRLGPNIANIIMYIVMTFKLREWDTI